MKALELALVAVLLASTYAVLSSRTVMMKLAVENEYWTLKHEAYSLARLLADSEVLLHYLEDGVITDDEADGIRVLAIALSPPNTEVVVRLLKDHEVVVEVSTPSYYDCTTAAVGRVVYTHPLRGSYVIEIGLGRV